MGADKNKRILFILGEYLPKPLANGICINEDVKYLLNNDYEVWCICNGRKSAQDDAGRLHIRRVQPIISVRLRTSTSDNSNKTVAIITKLLSSWQIILSSLSFPVESRYHSRKLSKEALHLITENDIQTVVGVNMPCDDLEALCIIKKTIPQTTVIPYCLDPITGAAANKFIASKRAFSMSCEFEERVLAVCDKMLVQLEHYRHYQMHHKAYMHKVIPVGVPLLVERAIGSSATYSNSSSEKPQSFFRGEDRRNVGKKTLLYCGSLNMINRDPSYIFRVMKHVKNVQLIMYITTDPEWVIELAKDNENISIYNAIPHDQIVKKMEMADGFLSLGNNQEMLAPSKVVEYISYGKPLVATYRVEKDTSEKYLAKYPYGLYLDERKHDYVEAANKIDRLLEDANDRINYEELKKIYPENTPSYFAEIISS